MLEKASRVQAFMLKVLVGVRGEKKFFLDHTSRAAARYYWRLWNSGSEITERLVKFSWSVQARKVCTRVRNLLCTSVLGSLLTRATGPSFSLSLSHANVIAILWVLLQQVYDTAIAHKNNLSITNRHFCPTFMIVFIFSSESRILYIQFKYQPEVTLKWRKSEFCINITTPPEREDVTCTNSSIESHGSSFFHYHKSSHP